MYASTKQKCELSLCESIFKENTAVYSWQTSTVFIAFDEFKSLYS